LERGQSEPNASIQKDAINLRKISNFFILQFVFLVKRCTRAITIFSFKGIPLHKLFRSNL
jgi:hypothetical protein